MRKNHLSEKQYFNFISAVAMLYNCRLLDVDIPRQRIRLEGSPDDMTACFHELSCVLGRT